ncbi:acetyl-CoA C-acyltransferase [Rhodospirillum sp. A1_3_36]|uniref:acetyl-CoA C-acyltransferase n=1 Tax=Rhodospirillum sp. A1_3_36 TaxID=3391666 RepID=UPI0039A5767D
MSEANKDPIVIVGAKRTPMGAFQGALSSLRAPELGGAAIKGALEQAGVPPERVGGAYMGCVLPAGLGQAPARQAAHAAGLTWDVPCTTVNKMCGSAMEASILAYNAIAAGQVEVMVAGGMESMSNAPYLLDKARAGQRLGHGKVLDHMFLDGLEDAYDRGRLMGTFAEDTAEVYQFTREEQDAYAITSLTRARAAVDGGVMDRECVTVSVPGRKGAVDVSRDETPGKVDPDKIPLLKPAFREGGTVTAANSSSISDGSAALVMTRASVAERQGWEPLAIMRGHAAHAHQPNLFTTAPVGAMSKLMDKVGWSKEAVDLWEINEAFAVVSMVALRDLDLDPEKVNVHGGACALGHPIGASGARIMVTLMNALKTHGLRKGVASLCIGGGEATAVALELV